MIRTGTNVVVPYAVYDQRLRRVPKGTVGKVQCFFKKTFEAYVGVFVNVEDVARVTFKVPGTGLVTAEINKRALKRAPKRRSKQ